jgi:hypothetical protein
MNTELKNQVEKYLVDNEVNFKRYIYQTNLFNHDGTINKDEIFKLAHSHVFILLTEMREKALNSLLKQIKIDINIEDWHNIIHLMFLGYMLLKNRIPIFILMLSYDNEILKYYCNTLYEELSCNK